MSKEKKKSKAQLAREQQAAQKKAQGREAQSRAREKKAKKDKPTRCKVMRCPCTGVSAIVVKQPGLARAVALMYWRDIPWNTRNLGAQWQDLRFGAGQRLHNPCFVKGKLDGWRCTVCGEMKRL